MKKIFYILSAIILFSATLFSKEISGVDLKPTITIEGQKLVLNGAGVRTVFLFDVYVGALYLTNKSNNAKEIIESNKPMDIKMVITSSLVTSKKMINGLIEAFDNAKKAGYTADKKSIEKFLEVFKEKIKTKDEYDLFFDGKQSVKIYKNHKLKATIDDFTFKKALFAIWLSSKPAQESLKKKMLGL